MKSDNQDKWRRRVRLIKSKISLVPSLHFKRKQKEMQAYSKAKIALKKKKVWWDFFLFLRVIFFNTTLLPLKPPLFLPEDARPGHAAHQQRWDVPAETCNYHVITAQEKINRDQTDLQSFIPCSICIQVNNTYIFFNLSRISTFHIIPMQLEHLQSSYFPREKSRERRKNGFTGLSFVRARDPCGKSRTWQRQGWEVKTLPHWQRNILLTIIVKWESLNSPTKRQNQKGR